MAETLANAQQIVKCSLGKRRLKCAPVEDDVQDRRRAVLSAWVAQAGGHAVVVRKHKLTPSQASYLSQVMNGYSFAERAARSMEKRLGMDKGLLDKSIPPEGRPPSVGPQVRGAVAHHLRDLVPMIAPTTISWESILEEPLRDEFALKLRDDSMEKQYQNGSVVVFSTVEGEPRAGDDVLVADSDENVFFRRFQARRPGHWQAVALNDAYQALDSKADGLRVLAIKVGTRGRSG